MDDQHRRDKPWVDLVFRVRGITLPADHAYSLYSAMSRLAPDLHANPSVAVAPIPGRLIGDRRLALDRTSRLILRLPAQLIPAALPLAGAILRIGEDNLTVGVPEVRPLQPRIRLASRIVVIKSFTEPEPFLEAASRQVRDLGIDARLRIPDTVASRSLEGRREQPPAPVRRTVRIRDKTIVGFPLIAENLAPEDSIRLQEHGIGGRRRFGCGVFV